MNRLDRANRLNKLINVFFILFFSLLLMFLLLTGRGSPLIEVTSVVAFAATDKVFVNTCGGQTLATCLKSLFNTGVQQFYHWSVVLLFVVFCHVVYSLINNLINNAQYDAHKAWHSQCRVNAVFAVCVPGLCGMSMIWG